MTINFKPSSWILIFFYTVGFISLVFSVITILGLQLASMAFQVECLVFCFAIKHQNIARVINYHVVSDDVYWTGVFFFIVTPVIAYLVFHQAGLKREDQMDFVKSRYPEYYEDFSKLSNLSTNSTYGVCYWQLVHRLDQLSVDWHS
ncbi:unnamed protein product [Caenorhabditis brenneri]